MRIIECDRCHKRIKGVSKTGYVNLDQRDIKTGGLDGNSEFDDWDICPDCMEKIRDFVRMVPQVRQEPDPARLQCSEAANSPAYSGRLQSRRH